MNTKEVCKIASIKPTIENVVPFSVYKKTQPRQLNNSNITNINTSHHSNNNSLNTVSIPLDQCILLGGGRDFILSLLNSSVYPKEKLESVDLFILNTCIVLWFDVLGHGLEIPYTSIVYHAIERNHNHSIPSTYDDGHSLALIITVIKDAVLNQFFPSEQKPESQVMIDSVELVLYPKYATYERHYNNKIENLFTFAYFGMNRGDELINNCNNALAMGMELHADSFRNDSEVENGHSQDIFNYNNDSSGAHASFDGISSFLQNVTYKNSGSADDLDNDEVFLNQIVNKNPSEAGMSLQFQLNDKSGGKRNLSPE